jgi:Cys-tRNA(Pro)/Cys-tRNA(Cys) deacylase
MAVSNNVTRMLDSRKVAYTALELPEEKLGAIETAEILNVPANLVYKTIIITRSKGKPVCCVVPGDSEVDLKAVSTFLGEKKVHVPTQAEAEQLTGLQAGGISPLALINKGFQVILDDSALNHDEIHISGGQRGLNIRMKASDIIRLTNARVATISLTHD